MPPLAIELKGVSKRYGEVLAVDGIDLEVRAGEIYGLIGHNGAGKSTLIKMMLGLVEPDAGQLRIHGRPVGGDGFRAVRRRVAYLPENVVFYDNLSGLETLEFFARLKGADRRTCLPLLEQVGIGHAADRAVRGYSKGMRQRLGFAQALLGVPDILFLDEPTSGLDPQGISELYAILSDLRDRGVTVLLCTHHLAQIEARVDRLALMRRGRIRAAGTVTELRQGLQLPLSLRVALAPEAVEALRVRLTEIARCDLRFDDGVAAIHCDRSQKMPVLNALTALSDDITDIDIREPSLEDIFLSYTGDAPAGPAP